jgi:hypothetical protein
LLADGIIPLGSGVFIRARSRTTQSKKQLIDPAHWMIPDVGQQIAQLAFEVNTVQFGGADQRVDA